MNHISKCITLLTSSLFLSFSSTGAFALDDTSSLNDLEVKDRRAAEAEDAQFIAKKMGWKLEMTARHLKQQKRFSKFRALMKQQFPTSFSGSVFAENPGDKSTIFFKGVVPDAAKSQAATENMNIHLVGGRDFSEQELNDRSLEVVKHLVKMGAKDIGATVMPDGNIEIVIQGKKQPINLPDHLRKGLVINFIDKPVSTPEHTYGGARISSNTGVCTTGFSVRHRTTLALGVSTAAHCTGMNSYTQPEGGPTYATNFQAQHLGSNGDVEWHTTPTHVVRAEYYARPNERRQVNSIATSISVNDWFCVYSRMQGTRSCDQVYSTGVISLDGLTIISNLIAMDEDNTVPGDSGGPWSFGTQAGGGHRGDQWIWFGTRNVWTPAHRFDNALNVDVLTQ